MTMHEKPNHNPPMNPPPYGYSPRAAWVGEQRPTSGLAIAAMVVGIVAIFGFVVPIIGVVLSVITLCLAYPALRKIRRENLGGRGFAITGVVLGWVGVGVTLLAVLFATVAIAA